MFRHYSVERNVQIVIALLKAHGIKRVIVSPGATNVTFVASIQQDPFFEIYSAPDERSAAYIACGMAAESGEAVALSCTGATASRNYLPGLTEAYYRHLPVLAITSTQHTGRIGSLTPQVIDRSAMQKDVVKLSVQIPTVNSSEDEWASTIKVNQAILELFRHGCGPVHINLTTTYSRDFSVEKLPPVQKIERFMPTDKLPELPQGRIGIFVGAHQVWNASLTETVNQFCEKHNAVVFCDHTSNYQGPFRIDFSLECSQNKELNGIMPDILIHIGMISGDYSAYKLAKDSQIWRVSPDGEIADTFRKLKYVFEMDEKCFFEYYTKAAEKKNEPSYWKRCKDYAESIRRRIPDIPFSNIWIASQTADKFPAGSVVHLGILNTLRSWNMFEFPEDIEEYCNTGGFGIDGLLSSCIGGALAQPDKLHFGIFGDLAFFYDMNSLGNRHVGKNLRIMLINNGIGTEFKNFNHPAAAFGDEANKFMAAAGHYGNKSPDLVRHYAEDLNFIYLKAASKDEYLQALPTFISPKTVEHPMIFEIFTDSKDENDALRRMMGIDTSIQATVKNVVKGVLGKKNVELLKKIVRK